MVNWRDGTDDQAETYVMGEEQWSGGELFSEHQDKKIELPQVDLSIWHEAPHKLIVTLLLID